jgi:hypothetical protein
MVVVWAGAALRTYFAFVQFWRVERQFKNIQLGQSRSSVFATFGRPNYYAGSCGVIHNPSKTCASEYVYSHPFAPLIPDYYIVAFSSDGRVIEANRWTSP